MLEFSDDYCRSTVSNMFRYENKIQSNNLFKAENEFESTFTPAVAGGGGIISIKRNDAFNSGLFKRLNKTKESHVVSMYLPLSGLFRFCQDIYCVYCIYCVYIKKKQFFQYDYKI